MPRISGIFKNPDGAAVPNVVIRFTQDGNSTNSFTRQKAEVTTDENGAYEIDLFAGKYIVQAVSNRPDLPTLGIIQVTTDSPDGTLNDFLIANNPPPFNPVVDFVQTSLSEMVQLQQTPAKSVGVFADIPVSAAGWYLVASDETKGGAAVVYLFAGGKRYWFAMVEDV